MIKIVPSTLQHLHEMKKCEGLFLHIDLNEIGHALITAGVCFSMVEDNRVIGCGGLIPKWKGVGEVWIAVSSELKDRPLLLVKETLRCLHMFNTRGGYHRIQMHIRSEDTGLHRWAESLGFTFEGKMRQYGPDRLDHDLYARIF